MAGSSICDRCGSKKITNTKEIICPKCNNLEALPKEIALKIFELRHNYLNTKYNEIIDEYDKNELILWLLEEREILADEFFFRYPNINFNRLFALNDLLKRAFRAYNIKGTRKPHYEDIMHLVDNFSSFIEYVESPRLLIEEGFAYCVPKEKFDLNDVNMENLFSNYSTYFDIDRINIVKSFEQNMIYRNEVAEKYLDDHKEKYDKINNNLTEPIDYTPELLIHSLYPTLKALYVGLTQNTLFREMFNLNYLIEKRIPIEVIPTLSKDYKNRPHKLLVADKVKFKQYIMNKFSNSGINDLYNNLIFSTNNQGIFPLFVEVEENIYISPSFLYLMKLYYIPIYYSKLFNKETNKRSDLFEKVKIPNKLKENGFKVRSNVTKKSKLQIDSIALKENKVFVIETKMWDTGKLFEVRQTHLDRERDLKGIVDGIKFTREKDNSFRQTRKPSLLTKINYVKQNLKTLCPDHERIISVEGLIITRSYPPLTEYKGVRIIGCEDIKNL